MVRRVFLFLATVAVTVDLSTTAARATEVQRVVSPLGIEAWLVENHTVPVIAVSFAFTGASVSDGEGSAGVANLVSYLLDEGAGELDSTTFQQRVANGAIDLSFRDGRDDFRGEMRTVTENADEAFNLLRLALTEPRFDAAPVERMRAAVLADIRDTVVDPWWMAWRTFYDRAFGDDHPYAVPSRGTAPDLAAIAVDDLRTFIDQRFTRDRLVIGVSGDITAEELAVRLDLVFGALPATGAAPTPPEVTLDGAGETVLVRREGRQSNLLFIQQGVPRGDPDFYAALVLDHIAGGGLLNSRLMTSVRQQRGLTYGISSGLYDLDAADLWVTSTSVSNENVSETIDVVRAEWQRLADEGVTATELEDAVTYLTGSFPLGLTSTRSIARQLVSMQINDLGIDYIDRRSIELEAVTLADVNRVAATRLAPDRFTVIVVGDTDLVEPPDLEIDAEALARRELGLEAADADGS